MELSPYHHNLLIDILDELEANSQITKEERKNERLMFESYKKEKDNTLFFNNEGYSKKYDCCLRLILKFFDIIWNDEE